jgi:hypothetical protein
MTNDAFPPLHVYVGVRIANKLEGLCSCLRGSVHGQAASLEEFEEAG